MNRGPHDLDFERQVREIFDVLADLDREEQRRRLLEIEDLPTRDAVGRLLGWDALASPSVLDRPLALPSGSLTQPSYTGLRIGPYILGELLGEGGTGTVYRAERRDGQFEQQVAVKLIRRDLAAPLARRRFQTEQQILASLEHPGIARLLDGGTTQEGIPFVILELVEGVPITEYCDREELDLAQRLRLFRSVCEAVHYAHRRLVVHRDLKPSNVLVSHDGQVKLLDFGIAKLLDATAEGDEDQTATEYRALTPAYASPEQLIGRPVTIASDVYSLGVILYELICGIRPYQRGSDSPHQLAERLQRSPPPTPSRALSAADPDTASRLAENRGLARREHRQRLQGDLDRVVAKAMTSDPEMRYESAREFEEDVERYLHGRPVIARSPTWRYRFGKFALRHKIALPLGILAAGLIASFALSTVVQSHRLREERDVAIAAREVAERERERAEAATQFLRDAFLLADPTETRGEDLTAREILELGADRVESELTDQPQLRAALLETLADVFIGLGRYDRASELAETAVEVRRARIAEQAVTLEDRQALARSLELLGAARLYEQRFGDAETLFEESHRLWVDTTGREDLSAATSLFYLAYLHRWQGRQEEAERAARRSLELRRGAPDAAEAPLAIADSLYLLGEVLGTSEDPAAALPYLEESLALYETAGPRQERKAITTLHALGNLHRRLGQPEGARSALGQAIERSRDLFGQHPLLADELVSWGGFLRSEGSWDEAEAALREAVSIYRAFEDEDLLIAGLAHLGHFLLQKPDLEAARLPLEEAVERAEGGLPTDDPRRGSILANLIALELRAGRYARVKDLCRQAIPYRRRMLDLGTDHPGRLAVGLGSTLVLCADANARTNDQATAQRQAQEARQLFAEHDVVWRTAVADSILSLVEAKRGDRSAGIAGLRDALERLEELKPGSRYVDEARHRLQLVSP